MIEILPKLLSWQSSTTTRRNLYKTYVEKTSSRLGHALRYVAESDPQTGKGLLSVLRELPDESFMRLLTSPEMFSRLVPGVTSDWNVFADFVTQSVEAELIRIGKTDLSTGVWAALGDWFYPQGHIDRRLQEKVEDIIWQQDRCFRAPLVYDRIIVDYSSPFAKDQLDIHTLPRASLDREKVLQVLEKLEQGYLGIENISESAFDNVNMFAKVIVLGSDLTVGKAFSSSSSSNQIGRMDIVNADLKGVDDAAIADALVHESIHSLLYIIELNHPFILDRETVEEIRIKSPWTGAELPVHSYLHACLVWFGLWQFWSLALRGCRFSPERVKSQVLGAERGFTKGSLIERLSNIRSMLAPEVCIAIDEVQYAVMMRK